MTVSKGFYRHYKGHVYYVYGIACLKHENDRRIVCYTSVKTEEGNEDFDFLARDEAEFEQWICRGDAENKPPMEPPWDWEKEREMRALGYEPRFAPIIDPEKSIVPT